MLREGGRPVVDEAWGEWLLDVRTPAKRQRLADIVGRWTRGCARSGFDAVEYDNLDSFTRSHGLLTRRQAVAYARRPRPGDRVPARRLPLDLSALRRPAAGRAARPRAEPARRTPLVLN